MPGRHRVVVPAGVALVALALTGCTAAAPPVSVDDLPSGPLCQVDETPDSCLDDVRLALQSAFRAIAADRPLTSAKYEQVVSRVVSPQRLRGAFSYARLTPVAEGTVAEEPVGPVELRVDVEGASGTWWLCPADGRLGAAPCDPDR